MRKRFFKILVGCLFLMPGYTYVSAQTIDPGAEPFRISGSLGGNVSHYTVSGMPSRRQPFGYSLFGAVNLSIYNFSLPFSVAISQQGTGFSQPFSRFGASPEYKWVKLHAGYRSLNYSEFTLNGVSFLGGGVELTPGKFRFSAMTGRLRKAIQEPDNAFERRQYKRTGYGFKIGYGANSHFDLSFFHAADDVSSLIAVDSLDRMAPPEASTSIGLSGKLATANKRWVFDYDLGASLYTRDLRAQKVGDQQSFGADLIDRFKVNISSNSALAGKTGFHYAGKWFNLGIRYRYIQGGYKTLGANYLLSDVEMITLNGGTRLFQNKLSISGSYGIQNNDLSNRRFAQTGRNIGSANIGFRPDNRWNFNVNFSNFSIYQTLLIDTLFADSIVVDQTNYQVGFTGSYIVVTTRHTHTYTLNTNVQNLSDRNATPGRDAGNQMMSLMFNYGIRFNDKNYGLSVGANYQDFSSFLTAQTRYGGNLGFNIHFLDRKLTMRIRQSWNRSVLDTYDDDLFNTQWTGSYTLAKKHTFTGSVGYILRSGRNRFSELRSTIGYRMRF